MKKLVKESITDILTPKPQEEIDKVLNKWSLEDKISAIEWSIDLEKMFDYLSNAGGKSEDIASVFLEEANEEQLKEFILDVIDEDEAYIQWLIQIVSDDVDNDKLKRIFKKFISNTGKEELEEILNNVIMQNPTLVHDIQDEHERNVWR